MRQLFQSSVNESSHQSAVEEDGHGFLRELFDSIGQGAAGGSQGIGGGIPQPSSIDDLIGGEVSTVHVTRRAFKQCCLKQSANDK